MHSFISHSEHPIGLCSFLWVDIESAPLRYDHYAGVEPVHDLPDPRSQSDTDQNARLRNTEQKSLAPLGIVIYRYKPQLLRHTSSHKALIATDFEKSQTSSGAGSIFRQHFPS